jgi:hypothetical protein
MKNFLNWVIASFVILSIVFFITNNNENFTTKEYETPSGKEFLEKLNNPQEIEKVRREIPQLINEALELEKKIYKRSTPVVKLSPHYSRSNKKSTFNFFNLNHL